MLAIFAQIMAVGVDDGGGVVINAGHLDFVDGHNENHLMFLGEFLHQRDGGAVGNAFGQLIPAGFLLGTKIRAIKELLEPEDLHFFLGGIGNEALMFGDHLLFYVGEQIFFRRPLTLSLNQAAANHAGHGTPPNKQKQRKSLLPARATDKIWRTGLVIRGHTEQREECECPTSNGTQRSNAVANMIIRKVLENKGLGERPESALEETPEYVEEMADGQVIFRGEWSFFTRK